MVEDMDLLKHSPSWDDYYTRSTLHQISMAFLTILWSNWFLFHLFNYFDNASYFMWKVFGHKSGNWSDYENVLRWRIQGEGWRGPDHPHAPLLSRAVGIFYIYHSSETKWFSINRKEYFYAAWSTANYLNPWGSKLHYYKYKSVLWSSGWV